jgi:Mrp family chromosome partitioning ATPase
MFDMNMNMRTAAAPVFDRRLVALTARQSFEAEQFRRLRHRIEDLAASRGVRVVAVTSAAPSEGKTTTAINLAATLAQSPDSRVLPGFARAADRCRPPPPGGGTEPRRRVK